MNSPLRRAERRRKSHLTKPPRWRASIEILERRELLSAAAFISEVQPAGSGNLTYAADWFEVTNPGPTDLDITGWRMDDNSNLFGNSVALRGLTSVPAGESAVFFENSMDPARR